MSRAGGAASASATIEEEETSAVALLVALTRDVRRLGASRLLYARLNWDAFMSSADPPGAATPENARASLTRAAQRDAAARQRACRAAASGRRTKHLRQLYAAMGR